MFRVITNGASIPLCRSVPGMIGDVGQQQTHRFGMVSHVVLDQRQKDIKLPRIGKCRRALVQHPRGIAKPFNATVRTAESQQCAPQVVTLQTALDRMLVETDRLVLHTLLIVGAGEFVIDLGIIRLRVVQVEQNGQRLGVLPVVAKRDRALDGLVHARHAYVF